MSGPSHDAACQDVAAALEVVRTGLAATEGAVRSGADPDLAPLEAQIRTLCERSTMLEAGARRAAADELDPVLARLAELEAALAASVLR
jgi:hypothetical protein